MASPFQPTGPQTWNWAVTSVLEKKKFETVAAGPALVHHRDGVLVSRCAPLATATATLGFFLENVQ